MELKQIEVPCPCCGARLTVDVRTQTVLRHAPPDATDAAEQAQVGERRWADASSRVADRPSAADAKLDEALTRERDKERRLDDLFDRARERLRDRDPDEGS